MLLGQNVIRESLVKKVALLMWKATCNLKVAYIEYLNTKDNSKNNLIATDKLLSELKNNKNELAKEILDKKDFLLKKSQWVFGGDGWAYDIGFVGFVHLIASNEDIHIMVFDTEVYSNTGGKSSKEL